MTKKHLYDSRLDSYKSFFDHEWFGKITDETQGTSLYQPVFDLSVAWRFTANTHVMPWIMTDMVKHAIEMNVNTAEPFGKRFIGAARDKLVERMRGSLRNMQRKQLQDELNLIYSEITAVYATPELLAPDEMWQHLLRNQEFQFALAGSQRLCYGAIYYAYEDFLARCVGLARGESDYRMPRRSQFQNDLTAAFGNALCDQCWCDTEVSLARAARHALVHNGCRVTDEFTAALKKASRSLQVCDDEIQIMAPDTTNLFQLLKDRVTQLIGAARQHPNIK